MPAWQGFFTPRADDSYLLKTSTLDRRPELLTASYPMRLRLETSGFWFHPRRPKPWDWKVHTSTFHRRLLAIISKYAYTFDDSTGVALGHL